MKNVSFTDFRRNASSFIDEVETGCRDSSIKQSAIYDVEG